MRLSLSLGPASGSVKHTESASLLTGCVVANKLLSLDPASILQSLDWQCCGCMFDPASKPQQANKKQLSPQHRRTLTAHEALLAQPQSLPESSLTVGVLGGHSGAESQRSTTAVLKAHDLRKQRVVQQQPVRPRVCWQIPALSDKASILPGSARDHRCWGLQGLLPGSLSQDAQKSLRELHVL